MYLHSLIPTSDSELENAAGSTVLVDRNAKVLPLVALRHSVKSARESQTVTAVRDVTTLVVRQL